MKKNRYDSKNTSDNLRGGRDISLTESGGLYGEDPTPGLNAYKQSMGPNTIPIKTREKDFAPQRQNPMDTILDRKKPQRPTTSKVNRKKNRYDTNKKNVLGHY